MWLPFRASPTGMCSDWELNWQLFVSQAGAQSTEPHQPGQYFIFSIVEQYSIVYHTVIHLAVDGHLDSFCILPITNMLLCTFVCKFFGKRVFISLGYRQEWNSWVT